MRKNKSTFVQTVEVLQLAQEIIDKNWSLYKEQTLSSNKEVLTTFIRTFIIKEENYYENKSLKTLLLKI